jgi:hypothetical protein
MQDSTRHYPLSIEIVKKIQEQNRQGIKPDALETVEIISGKPKEAEPEFVDVVGHISLKSLDKNNRKHRDNNRNRNSKNVGDQNQQRGQSRNRQGGSNPDRRNNRNSNKKNKGS